MDRSRIGGLRAMALVAVVLAVGVPQGPADSQTANASRSGPAARWALVIGVDQYDDADISRLHFAVADAKAVARALVQHAGYAQENVKVMTSDVASGVDRPTDTNVIKRLDALAMRIGPDDTFLFYFSGHGYQREEDRHFLGTVNADPSSIETLERSSLPLQLLQRKMAKIRARRVVFLVDACRNDPERGKGDAPNRLSGGFARDLQIVASSGASGQAGSAVLLACSQGERAYEWPEKQHGVFTYYLLEALGGQAAGPGGELTAAAVGDYVQRRVLAWAGDQGKQQRPDLVQRGAARIVLGQLTGGVSPAEPPVSVEPVVTTATLQITTDPPGASVSVDDAAQALVTPCTITVDLETARTRVIELGVKLQGYRAVVRRVTLARGRSVDLPLRLERLPDPTPPVAPVNPAPGAGTTTDDAEMVRVPAGEFIMGSNDGEDDEKPVHRVFVRDFLIDKYEVSNDQYARFLNANDCFVRPAAFGTIEVGARATGEIWLNMKSDMAALQQVGGVWQPRQGWGAYPVVFVTWHGAAAYVKWAGKRLPTEAEWEKAARGTNGRRYPWGDQWDPDRCSHYGSTPRRLWGGGHYPGGESPYGCMDMAGNVSEWTSSVYARYPYRADDGREDPASRADRVFRGGGAMSGQTGVRAASRSHYPPSTGSNTLGFRCARSLPQQRRP